MNLLKKLVLSGILSLSLFANCDMEAFNLANTHPFKIKTMLYQLSDECKFTIIIKDKYADQMLNQKIDHVFLKNAPLKKVLDVLLKYRGLSYNLQDDILTVSFLQTKTFDLDYLMTKRNSEATTNASVDTGAKSSDINKIESKDSFDFWENTQKEIYNILNRPEDKYKAEEPIIDKNAGLITVTGTSEQIKRVEKYLHKIKHKIHKEVAISVSVIAVTLNKSYKNGIDWSTFQANLTGDENFQYNGTGTKILNEVSSSLSSTFFQSSFSMKGLLNFLHSKGRVEVLSNPKILTLNNQPALITVGDTLNYNVPSNSVVSDGGNLATQSYTPGSVFVGILLNITPEITDNNHIILRVNPSVSELKDAVQTQLTNGQRFREIAPDISEKKISSVLKIQNNATVVMGGLITKTKNLIENGVPILKDFPIVGNLFKSKDHQYENTELVFVIHAKIIDTDKSVHAHELGFKNVHTNTVKTHTKQQITHTKLDDHTKLIKALKIKEF